jgi:hypothetical protein
MQTQLLYKGEKNILKNIRNFCSKLANHNYRVLWAEAVVLAVLIGHGLGGVYGWGLLSC